MSLAITAPHSHNKKQSLADLILKFISVKKAYIFQPQAIDNTESAGK